MPAIGDPQTLAAKAAEFPVSGLPLRAEADAAAAVRASLVSSGMLLVGESHGVRENPQLVFALMREFGVGGIALEWPSRAAGQIAAWRAGGPLPSDLGLWTGDGRVTAGHYALLRARLPGDRLPEVVLFDAVQWQDGMTWSDRDAAMAAAVLQAAAPEGGWLVIAGSYHTRVTELEYGQPMGLHLTRARPGVRSVQVRYLAGWSYNGRPRQFAPAPVTSAGTVTGTVTSTGAGAGLLPPGSRQVPARLVVDRGNLVLDLAEAHEADVAHRADVVW